MTRHFKHQQKQNLLITAIMLAVFITALLPLSATAAGSFIDGAVTSITVISQGDENNFVQWTPPDSVTTSGPFDSGIYLRFIIEWELPDDVQQDDYFTVGIPASVINISYIEDFAGLIYESGHADDPDYLIGHYYIESDGSDGKQFRVVFDTDYILRFDNVNGEIWRTCLTNEFDDSGSANFEVTINGSLVSGGATVDTNPPTSHETYPTPYSLKLSSHIDDTMSFTGSDGKIYHWFKWDVWCNFDYEEISDFSFMDTLGGPQVLLASLGENCTLPNGVTLDVPLEYQYLCDVLVREYIYGDDITLQQGRLDVLNVDYNNGTFDADDRLTAAAKLVNNGTTEISGIDGESGLVMSDVQIDSVSVSANLGRLTRPTAISYVTVTTVPLEEYQIYDSKVADKYTNDFVATGGVAEQAHVYEAWDNGGAFGSGSTYEFTLTKTDNDGAPLDGAVFGLYQSADCTGTPFRTAESGLFAEKGDVRFALLAAGTYYLKEVSAPTGFQEDSRVYRVELISSTTWSIFDAAVGGNVIIDKTIQNIPEESSFTLVINKNLAGYYMDWGVDESSVFHVKIKDTVKDNYLLFKMTPEADGSYRCVGNTVDGLNEPYTGVTTQELPLSMENPLTISNLWAEGMYEVEEAAVPHCIASYAGNGAIYEEGQNSVITVFNTYEHGTGALVINKKLAGSYTDWGVDGSSAFHVRIKDTINDNYLLFKMTPEADGSYRCVGNTVDGLNEPYAGATTPELPLTAGSPLAITNLWVGAVYEAEETAVPHCIASYVGNSAIYEEGQNSVVTVLNTYEHGTGALIINKKLVGSYTDWGVDETSVFYVSIKDTVNDNYLLFKMTPEADGSYRCVGNTVDGLNEPYTGATMPELPLSAGTPLTISNLWAGAVYKVEEADVPHCKASYVGNGAIYEEEQNSIVTVFNTYEHGTGALVINKELVGSYTDWDIDRFTEFTVKIKDVTGGNYLLFKAEPDADGSYRCVGNSIDGITEPYEGTTIAELKVATERPLVIKNLWVYHKYEIEETTGLGYTASYENNNMVFQDGQNSIVTIFNTYEPTDSGKKYKKNNEDPPPDNLTPPDNKDYLPQSVDDGDPPQAGNKDNPPQTDEDVDLPQTSDNEDLPQTGTSGYLSFYLMVIGFSLIGIGIVMEFGNTYILKRIKPQR